MLDPDLTLTGETITVKVTPGQYEVLLRDAGDPVAPTVTHTLTVGPHVVPGVWVVTSGRGSSDGHREITLTKAEARD